MELYIFGVFSDITHFRPQSYAGFLNVVTVVAWTRACSLQHKQSYCKISTRKGLTKDGTNLLKFRSLFNSWKDSKEGLLLLLIKAGLESLKSINKDTEDTTLAEKNLCSAMTHQWKWRSCKITCIIDVAWKLTWFGKCFCQNGFTDMNCKKRYLCTVNFWPKNSSEGTRFMHENFRRTRTITWLYRQSSK